MSSTNIYNTNFYVYAYIRSKDSKTAKAGTPWYIGKGKNNRAWDKHHFQIPDKKFIIILESNLTESEAFFLEKKLILDFGRKDLGTGILRNMTVGGDGITGLKHSDQTKDKISKANTGKSRSQETKLKISQSKIGEKNPQFGKLPHNYSKSLSKETRDKISQAKIGISRTIESLEKMAETNRKKYLIKNPEGISFETKNIKQFSQEHGLCYQHMQAVARGTRKHHKKWTCELLK